MDQRVHPDGRVELTDADQLMVDSPYANSDLSPTPVAKRHWTTYNYSALWVGMCLNIPSYGLAAGLILLGMNWLQAFLIITLGNLIVLVPMLLNSHGGTKYGIPYPVFARAFFGIRGANLAALLRAFVGCGWFGIQTWIGGGAIHLIAGKLFGDGWLKATPILDGVTPWTQWLSFFLFFLVQVWVIWRGMETLKWFENWAAPIVLLAFLALAVWIITKAGLGPIMDQPGMGWGTKFWAIAIPSLMGMIAFWATLSLNMPDFTRFARSQKDQLRGQLISLPTTMALIAILSIIITSGAKVLWPKESLDPNTGLFNPVNVVARIDNPIVVVFSLIALILATMTTNVAANTVSPAYDFINALPRFLDFQLGGVIACVVGIAMAPWYLISNPQIYIFVWLNVYGGVLAAIAGVLVAGYWILAKTKIEMGDLYKVGGRYWYSAGWNWRALVAFFIGAIFAVGGAYTKPGESGPFPSDGLIPFLQPLYDYSWLVGFSVGLVVFVLLNKLSPPRVPAAVRAPVHAQAGGTEQEWQK